MNAQVQARGAARPAAATTFLLAAVVLTTGCHSLHGAYMPLGPALPPRPPDAPVQIYLDGRLPEDDWQGGVEAGSEVDGL